MLGRVLMLLACVPLIVPNGVCLCDAGDTFCEFVSLPTTHAPSSVFTHSTLSHHSCSHNHAKAENQREQPRDTEPQTPQHHHDHHDGCPASDHAIDRASFTEASPEIDHVASSLSFCFVPLPLLLLPVRCVDRSRLVIPHSSPPLYLTHCAIII
jgi:hypothetical protein